MGRRVLVTGGRKNYDYITIHQAIKEICRGDDTLVNGLASGVDMIAAQAARYLDLAVDCWPADWDRYGKAAGGLRNQEMLDAGVDLALVFKGGRGTKDMLGRLLRADIEIVDYQRYYRGILE